MDSSSRYVWRRRRKRAVRKVTLTTRNSERELHRLRVLNAAHEYDRPQTRGECLAMERPCPFVGCRYHLYLDVSARGGLTLNFPDLEPHELLETCALDVADFGDHALEDVGELMNMTRERVRQIEVPAKEKVVEAMRANWADKEVA